MLRQFELQGAYNYAEVTTDRLGSKINKEKRSNGDRFCWIEYTPQHKEKR